MKTRIVSAILGLCLLLGIVGVGGWILNISILIVSVIGIFEFHGAMKSLGLKPISYINYGLAFGFFVTTFLNIELFVMPLLLTYILILLFSLVFKKQTSLSEISVTLLAGFYIPFFFYHISLLNGNPLIWLVFIIAWATDTFAYFSGKLFGKRKLAPILSPNKTIEGAIGGVIGSIFTTILFLSIQDIDINISFIILSLVTSIISMIGDLTASKIKRLANIKDYGYIMPGHGGVLDRFDSILFTAPIVYYYVELFI